MSDPVTAGYVIAAVAAVGAGAQYEQNRQAVSRAGDASEDNAREQYRVAEEQSHGAQTQASEQMTDRMRAANRQLSLARVVAAEGGGSFAAQAINISAGENEDIARIGTGLKNVQSGIRDDENAIRVSQKNTNGSLVSQAGAIRTRFLSETANLAGNAYVNGERQKAEKLNALNRSSDYRTPTYRTQ